MRHSPGVEVLERLDELNRTQWLSYDELLALQSKKLQRLVEYAYQYVPYYQKVFDTVGFHPEDLRQNPDYFSKLPVLTKSIIRENWDELLTTEPERRQQLSKLSTSGSTGNPLIFMQDPDFRDVVTADIQRHIGWAGCGLGDRHAFIWGASQRMHFRQKMRIRSIDRVWNRFQIDAFTMTEETMANFAPGFVVTSQRYSSDTQRPCIVLLNLFEPAHLKGFLFGGYLLLLRPCSLVCASILRRPSSAKCITVMALWSWAAWLANVKRIPACT